MKKQTRWEKCMVKCPEEKVEVELLVEWKEEGGKRVPNSVSCNHPKLMDLKPVDCEWSCWDEIAAGKK